MAHIPYRHLICYVCGVFVTFVDEHQRRRALELGWSYGRHTNWVATCPWCNGCEPRPVCLVGPVGPHDEPTADPAGQPNADERGGDRDALQTGRRATASSPAVCPSADLPEA